jgi:hypothetical protein
METAPVAIADLLRRKKPFQARLESGGSLLYTAAAATRAPTRPASPPNST